MHHINSLRESIERLIKENQEQKERMDAVLDSIDKVDSRVKFTEKIISTMQHNGAVPEVIAETLNIELNQIDEERFCDRLKKKPMDYLNEEETNEFEKILEKIKSMDFRELTMDDTFIYHFIDQVTSRYNYEVKNFKETEDDLKFSDNVNLHKLGMIHDRDLIAKYLIRRLTNEIAYQKQKSMIEALKLDQSIF